MLLRRRVADMNTRQNVTRYFAIIFYADAVLRAAAMPLIRLRYHASCAAAPDGYVDADAAMIMMLRFRC